MAPRAGRHNVGTLIFATFVAAPAVVFWFGAVFLLIILGAVVSGGEEEASCNVARIPIHGIIVTSGDGFMSLLGMGYLSSSDELIDQIRDADDDDTVDAIVLDIDSPGGLPVAADETMAALLDADKPVVAVIRGVGASAAYWIAAGADHIIASPASDVGSIGVTMSYREIAESKEQEGSRWIDLSSGFFKDAGNPERTLREEEQAYFKGQVDTLHEYMVSQIARARPAISRAELAALADGRAWLGVDALAKKLIDELGSFHEAMRYVESRARLEPGEAVLCAPQTGSLGDLF